MTTLEELDIVFVDITLNNTDERESTFYYDNKISEKEVKKLVYDQYYPEDVEKIEIFR